MGGQEASLRAQHGWRQQLSHRLLGWWYLGGHCQDLHSTHRACEAHHPDTGCQPPYHVWRDPPLHRHSQLLHPCRFRAGHPCLLAWQLCEHLALLPHRSAFLMFLYTWEVVAILSTLSMDSSCHALGLLAAAPKLVPSVGWSKLCNKCCAEFQHIA